MKTKKEILESVLNDPTYSEVAKKLSPDERRNVEGILSGKILDLIYAIQMVGTAVVTSPAAVKEIIEAGTSTDAVFKVDASGEEHATKRPE